MMQNAGLRQRFAASGNAATRMCLCQTVYAASSCQISTSAPGATVTVLVTLIDSSRSVASNVARHLSPLSKGGGEPDDQKPNPSRVLSSRIRANKTAPRSRRLCDQRGEHEQVFLLHRRNFRGRPNATRPANDSTRCWSLLLC